MINNTQKLFYDELIFVCTTADANYMLFLTAQLTCFS